jgi:predicted MFS family arabinose efflux permease
LKDNRSASLDRRVASLVSIVYFVQGALGVSGVAFPLFLRGEGWSISQITTLSFISGLPWTLKVLYGTLSDALPIGGFRRKPYVVLASALSAGAWLGLSTLPENPSLIYFWGVLASLGFAMTDVVTDALIVEHSTGTSPQLYQSLAWGFRSLGAVLGGIAGGLLAQYVPYRLIFAGTALLPLSTLITGFAIHDVRKREAEGIFHLVNPLAESLRSLLQGDLKWFCLLLLAGSFSAAFSTPFFFFLREKLGFTETFLGALSSLTWSGAILGCFFYGRLLREVPLKRMLAWGIGLNAVSVLSSYLVVNRWSAATLFFLGGILGYVSLLPLMASAAVLARKKGIEGSLFALLMSVHNLGQIVATFLGGKLFDIIGLGSLIFLSALVGLTGFLFVRQLRTV